MLPAPLPGWIARALTRRLPPQATPIPLPRNETVHPVPYALAALREETIRVAAAAEGTRNDALNKAAFNLGQLVAEGCLSEAAVATALADAAGASGLPEREAGRTIRSGMTAGARRPRAPPPHDTAPGDATQAAIPSRRTQRAVAPASLDRHSCCQLFRQPR
jgi:hypothetical protein